MRKLAVAVVLCFLLSLSPAFVIAFSNGEAATTVVGQSNFTSSTGATSTTGERGPTGIAFDSSGNMWVAEYANNRVMEYNYPITTGEAASIVLGQSSFTTGGISASATGLDEPIALAFDKSGNLWVADAANDRVVEFTYPFSTGEAASIVLGQSGFGTGGSGTSATQMSRPYAVAFDSSGNLWVAESTNNRVIEFVKGAGFTTGEAASIVLGQSSFTTSTPATSATGLSYPSGLAFDSSGNLWVGDQDNNRVVEFTKPFTTGETESVVIGQSSFTTSTAATTATGLSGPAEISFDQAGNLWVPEYANNRVTEFAAPLSTGEAATGVLGQTGFTTSGIATSATGEDYPWGTAVDSSNNIWVADYENNRVLGYGGTPVYIPPNPLPSVIPKHLPFNFYNGPTITGNEVSLYGVGVLYNVPGYNPTNDLYPNTISICSNAANSTVTVRGFIQLEKDGNATEFLAYYWSSMNMPSQGWPKEPSC